MNDWSEILGLALLGLIPVGVLAFLLFVAARRRKAVPAKRAETAAPIESRTVDAEAQAQPRNVTPMPAAAVRTSTLDESPADHRKPQASPATITPVHAAKMNRNGDRIGGLPHSGASVALPAKAPESAEARVALLNSMVEARPDRANPFQSRKARRHRAKLILNSLGRSFENSEPKIDLSQYPNNWPALAKRHQRVAA